MPGPFIVSDGLGSRLDDVVVGFGPAACSCVGIDFVFPGSCEERQSARSNMIKLALGIVIFRKLSNSAFALFLC